MIIKIGIVFIFEIKKRQRRRKNAFLSIQRTSLEFQSCGLECPIRIGLHFYFWREKDPALSIFKVERRWASLWYSTTFFKTIKWKCYCQQKNKSVTHSKRADAYFRLEILLACYTHVVVFLSETVSIKELAINHRYHTLAIHSEKFPQFFCPTHLSR